MNKFARKYGNHRHNYYDKTRATNRRVKNCVRRDDYFGDRRYS
jgi:hypothetical protein